MALREVNLIPTEILLKRRLIWHLFLWMGSLAILLGLIFGFQQYQLQVLLHKNRPKTTLADVHIRLGATIAEIKLAQQEIEKLSPQDAFLKTLNTHQSFSEVLLKLATLINGRTWLTRLTIAGSPESESVAAGIQLHGYSVSNDEVGNFLTQLSEAPLFKNVVLRYARETQITPPLANSKILLKVIQFRINCETKRTNA